MIPRINTVVLPNTQCCACVAPALHQCVHRKFVERRSDADNNIWVYRERRWHRMFCVVIKADQFAWKNLVDGIGHFIRKEEGPVCRTSKKATVFAFAPWIPIRRLH